MQRVRKAILRLLTISGLTVVGCLLLLAGCQSKLIYFPRPYGPGTVSKWQKITQGKAIDVQTSQGQQRSFLQGNLKNPRHLWIVCGGNGTVALDWSDWFTEHASRDDAYLLVDFPGYGDCHGKPTPARIRENFRKAIPAAMQELGWTTEKDSARLRFFGHSLGSAGCLMAADEFHIQRGVLIAPFSSTMAMAKRITHLPIGFLVWHRMDNDARLTGMEAHGPGKVIIFHGVDDEVIPVEMSRGLAVHHPAFVKLIEIPSGRHNTIPSGNAAQLAQAMHELE